MGAKHCADASFVPPRTELHLNHLAENNVFGIVPLAKVRGLWGLGWQSWALGAEDASSGLECHVGRAGPQFQLDGSP